jgi:hypothetical protein
LAKIINFEVESAEIIEEDSNSQFATAKIRAFSSDANRHDMYCSEEVLQRTAPTIYNKPILYSIDRRLDDFYTHVNPEDSLIAGFVIPNQAEFERLPDGRLSLNVFAKIWKRYAPKVVQLFKRDSNHKSVSVEMELYQTVNMDSGLVEMLDFAYAGVTLLGDFVTEASPGASMQLLSFSEENKHFQDAYNFEFKNYDEINLKIPNSVKNNAKIGIDLSNKSGIGGTSVNLANARYLLKYENIEPDRVRQIFKKLSSLKNSISGKIDGTDPQHVSWMLHGGSEGLKWSKDIIDKMDEINNRNISYFGDIVTFPYSSLQDANPAIRGIDPPVTLGQANEISRQADAIGQTEDKNGWAIAISNFKKNHEIIDGKWVRRNNMAKDMDSQPVKEESIVDKEVKTKDFEKVEDEKFEDNVSMAEKADADAKAKADAEKEDDDKEDLDEKDEEEEDKVEKMSTKPFDFSDARAMFSEDFENYADVAKVFSEEQEEVDYAKMATFMYRNMAAMRKKVEDLETAKKEFAEEFAALKKFKAEKDAEKFTFAIDSTLKEIESKTNIPSEKLEELKKQAEGFALDTIDQWKNLARSTALDFAVKESEDKSSFPVYGLPFQRESKQTDNGSPWKK